jgi:hypothetical protein
MLKLFTDLFPRKMDLHIYRTDFRSRLRHLCRRTDVNCLHHRPGDRRYRLCRLKYRRPSHIREYSATRKAAEISRLHWGHFWNRFDSWTIARRCLYYQSELALVLLHQSAVWRIGDDHVDALFTK